MPHEQSLGRRQRPLPSIKEESPFSETFLQVDRAGRSGSTMQVRFFSGCGDTERLELCIMHSARAVQTGATQHPAVRSRSDSCPSHRVHVQPEGFSGVSSDICAQQQGQMFLCGTQPRVDIVDSVPM